MSVGFSDVLFTRCVFEDNAADDSGGARLTDSRARLVSCVFRDNRAYHPEAGGGGGLTSSGTELALEECVFYGNSASASGGGVSIFQGTASLTGCTFAGNTATFGAGIGVYDAPAAFDRVVVAFNTGGPGIECTGGAPEVGIACSDLYRNEGGDWVGCVAGRLGEDGNFSADPLFCDLAEGDLTLTGHSPCLPGEHPEGADCGLIGALGYGCGDPTAVLPSSWGNLKSTFAPPRGK